MKTRLQKEIWETEHKTGVALPGEMLKNSSLKPSGHVERFVHFLSGNNIVPPKRVVDIGCGKGRNLLYLAKLGFMVDGMDYVDSAIIHIQQLLKKEGLTNHANLHVCAIDEEWSFPDNTFDFAIDNYSSIDIETVEGRQIYVHELYRTLKPGGYAMVAVVSSDDELEKEMIEKSPGKEKNSTIWPENGKFQKDYDEEELREFYKSFKVIRLEKISKPATKLGRNYTATNFWMILQKPLV